MKITRAAFGQMIKNNPSIFQPVPYVKYGLNKFFNIRDNNRTDELHALAVLGTQLAGGGLLYGILKGSLKCIVASGVIGGIFGRCYQQTLLMKDLEKILRSIKKNNATLKKHLEDFKKETDEKIASLRICVATFNHSNKLLRGNVTDLRKQLKTLEQQTTTLQDLIESTQTTVENLEKLKKDEQEALERFEAINRKLEIVTELLSEEKKQLSTEVKRLSSEINRLADIQA